MNEIKMSPTEFTFGYGIGLLEGIVRRVRPRHAPGDPCRPVATGRRPIERQQEAIEAALKHLLDADQSALILDIEMSGGKTHMLAAILQALTEHCPVGERLRLKAKAAGWRMEKRILNHAPLRLGDAREGLFSFVLPDGSLKEADDPLEAERLLDGAVAGVALPKTGWKKSGAYNVLYTCPTTCTKKVRRELEMDVPGVRVIDLTQGDAMGKLSRFYDGKRPGVTVWTLGYTKLSRQFQKRSFVLESVPDRLLARRLTKDARIKNKDAPVVAPSVRCPRCGAPITLLKGKEVRYLNAVQVADKKIWTCRALRFPHAKKEEERAKRCGEYLGTIMRDFVDKRKWKAKLSGKRPNNKKWKAHERALPISYLVSRKYRGAFDFVLVDEMQNMRNDSQKAWGIARILSSVTCRGKRIGSTGTLVGGYPDQLWNPGWSLNPRSMQAAGFSHTAAGWRAFKDRYGACEKRTIMGRHGTPVQKHPHDLKGMSTRIFPEILSGWSISLQLLEIAPGAMVPYREHLLPVALSVPMREAYDRTSAAVMKEMTRAAALGFKERQRFLSSLLHARWSGMDNLMEQVVEMTLEKKDPDGKVIDTLPVRVTIPALSVPVTPKEQEVIDIARRAKKEGQKSLVYVAYTGKRDTAPRLREVFAGAGLNMAVLRSGTVDPARREEWLAALPAGVDGVICHPLVVAEGLDLLPFTTIVVYTPAIFDLYLLRQAIRRSWRLNQPYRGGVDVYFAFYEATAQEDALIGIATGLDTALIASGIVTDSEIFDMSTYGEGSIVRKLVSDLEAAIDSGAIVSATIRRDALKGNETEAILAISAAEVIANGGKIPDIVTAEGVAMTAVSCEPVQTVQPDGSVTTLLITRYVPSGRGRKLVTEEVAVGDLADLPGSVQLGFQF
jgi:hypothetical protein